MVSSIFSSLQHFQTEINAHIKGGLWGIESSHAAIPDIQYPFSYQRFDNSLMDIDLIRGDPLSDEILVMERHLIKESLTSSHGNVSLIYLS
jgi:hypothetical protein